MKVFFKRIIALKNSILFFSDSIQYKVEKKKKNSLKLKKKKSATLTEKENGNAKNQFSTEGCDIKVVNVHNNRFLRAFSCNRSLKHLVRF